MNTETQLTEEEKYAQFVAEMEDEAKPAKTAETTEEQAAPPAQEEEVEEPQTEEPELFPGYSALPAEQQAAAKQAWEAHQAKAAELERKFGAAQGQLGPVQRKLAETERALNQTLQQFQQVQAKVKDGQNTASKTAWEAYKQQFPDEAAALEAHLNPVQSTVSEVQTELQRLREEHAAVKQEMDLQRNSAMVMKTHPDAYEILNDPAFDAWVEALDEDDKARASSTNPKDAIKTLDQFKRDKMLAEFLNSQDANQKPAATTPRKQPKLDVDPNPRNRQSPAKQTQANAYGSEEEAFAAFAEQYESDPNMFRQARR